MSKTKMLECREDKSIVISAATHSFSSCIIASLGHNSVLKDVVPDASAISHKSLQAIQLSRWSQVHVHFISGCITKKNLLWV